MIVGKDARRRGMTVVVVRGWELWRRYILGRGGVKEQERRLREGQMKRGKETERMEGYIIDLLACGAN